jgi:hypothetical protein
VGSILLVLGPLFRTATLLLAFNMFVAVIHQPLPASPALGGGRAALRWSSTRSVLHRAEQVRAKPVSGDPPRVAVPSVSRQVAKCQSPSISSRAPRGENEHGRVLTTCAALSGHVRRPKFEPGISALWDHAMRRSASVQEILICWA